MSERAIRICAILAVIVLLPTPEDAYDCWKLPSRLPYGLAGTTGCSRSGLDLAGASHPVGQVAGGAHLERRAAGKQGDGKGNDDLSHSVSLREGKSE